MGRGYMGGVVLVAAGLLVAAGRRCVVLVGVTRRRWSLGEMRLEVSRRGVLCLLLGVRIEGGVVSFGGGGGGGGEGVSG